MAFIDHHCSRTQTRVNNPDSAAAVNNRRRPPSPHRPAVSPHRRGRAVSHTRGFVRLESFRFHSLVLASLLVFVVVPPTIRARNYFRRADLANEAAGLFVVYFAGRCVAIILQIHMISFI